MTHICRCLVWFDACFLASTVLSMVKYGGVHRTHQDVSSTQRDIAALTGARWLGCRRVAFNLPQKMDLPLLLYKITSQSFSEIDPLMDLHFYVKTVIFHETGEAGSERRHF